MQEMLGLLKLIDRDMATMRTTIDLKQIKISRYLPMNSVKGMKKFFRVSFTFSTTIFLH